LGNTSSPGPGGSDAAPDACHQLLEYCLHAEPWPLDLLPRALAQDNGRAFFSVVVERLGDLFDPRLAEIYAILMTEVLAECAPLLLTRVRIGMTPHTPPDSVDRIYVLSRITLGADVAITSVLIDAMKQRYPEARIVFVGPRKSYELFEADPRVEHQDAPYARSGSLADRLEATASIWFEDGIVVDPDSRLSQLGLISVCPEMQYFHFPSRGYGANSESRLPDLTAHWAKFAFGVTNAKPYIAPRHSTEEPADITVSLGVGENDAKRYDEAFELELMKLLASTGRSILVDMGGSREERERVERVLQPGMRTHDGSFAPFAALIAKSKLYVGYDSAGGHVASACGVPLISIAKGFANERMAARWRPNGYILSGPEAKILQQVAEALQLAL
jgi:hypothetical protein